MMPKVVLTFRLAHRFMTAKSRRHIPETLEHEQTQQDGNEKTRMAQKFLFRQKFLKWTIASKFDVIKLQKQNLYQSLLHLETVLFLTN